MLFKLNKLEEAIVREWYMSSVDRSAGNVDLYMFHPLWNTDRDPENYLPARMAGWDSFFDKFNEDVLSRERLYHLVDLEDKGVYFTDDLQEACKELNLEAPFIFYDEIPEELKEDVDNLYRLNQGQETFRCPKCGHGTVFDRCSAYYEYYDCIKCNGTVVVN